MSSADQANRSVEIARRVTARFQRRMQLAQDNFSRRLDDAAATIGATLRRQPASALEPWAELFRYSVDFAQRSVLFWDTLRQRGNNFLEHERAGSPPVLYFDYETLLDARQFARPANYSLLRIVPPSGVSIDARRRPYIIIDPRAGHGPGIGGFKADSEVGVALRAGHPVYFVAFFPHPEPGQTLLDVTEAERRFVQEVRKRHPLSPKPALVGNCQGGWAAMMLAAADPGEVGPIVINGAPMSYWSGASVEGQAENPMRYAGGLLGGTWLASLAADIGHGVFDGAHLVRNFENLNPANTFWGKYYNLFVDVDREAPRFLEFERWWGGFFLMNREEIEWITRNLFIGNDLWSGDVSSSSGAKLDLRNIRSPIILFASMGDDITPAQQAFNWVADVYGSTEEIKARGQVIVGLLHQSAGHLGIFVSGSVARKEHAQIVSVLKSIEALAPGLYGMEVTERKEQAAGAPQYDVHIVEKRLENVMRQTNPHARVDERPFEAVEAVSDFNQRAYDLFARPLVQALASEHTANLSRELHPLRLQHKVWSDLNPWLAWLRNAAPAVREHRQPLAEDSPARTVERATSDVVSASLDCYREMRDAMSEALFFQVYGNIFTTCLANGDGPACQSASPGEGARDPRPSADAIARITRGGYAEALARVAALLAVEGEPLPLAKLEQRAELARDYRDLLPQLPAEQWRRVRGEQEIIARQEPERAIAAVPALLAEPRERRRLLALFDRLLADRRVQGVTPTAGQKATLERLRALLEPGSIPPRPAALGGA